MGEREQGWVRERQLIQIGGGDDADEDTTSVSTKRLSSSTLLDKCADVLIVWTSLAAASSSLGLSSTYLLCRGDQHYLGRSHHTSYDLFGRSYHAYHISCRPHHLGSGRHP